MPKGPAEWFGAQCGSGYIVRNGGGANTFGIAPVQRELGSLKEGQRLEWDMTRVKGRHICPVILRPVDSAGVRHQPCLGRTQWAAGRRHRFA